MQLLLQGVRIVDTASPYHLQVCDIRIQAGVIQEISAKLEAHAGEQVVAMPGVSVSPGWMDMMAMSGEPGQEYREDLQSFLDAAQAGGYTRVCHMPATHPALHSRAEVELILSRTAMGKVSCHPLGAITRNLKGTDLTEIYDMQAAGAVAFTDADEPVYDAGIMMRTLQYVKPFKGTVINVPCDHRIVGQAGINEGIWSTRLGMYGIPDVLEEIMVFRDLQLAAYTGSRVHLASISSARSVQRIREAKAAGVQVTASVTPYHLFFDESAVGDYDTNFKVNPPLRTSTDVAALKEGIADGTIDAVVSYHIPWDSDAKSCEFEYAHFGMATLEACFAATCAALLGYVDVGRLLQLFTTGPRYALGFEPLTIQVGASAELTLFDDSTDWVLETKHLKSKAINQAFTGKMLKGKPVGTIHKGNYYPI